MLYGSSLEAFWPLCRDNQSRACLCEVLKDLGAFRVREVFLDPRRENLASSRYNALLFHSPGRVLEKAVLRVCGHCERVLFLRRNPIINMDRLFDEGCFGSDLCCTASQC